MMYWTCAVILFLLLLLSNVSAAETVEMAPGLKEFKIHLYKIQGFLGQGGQGTVMVYEKMGVSNNLSPENQYYPQKIAVKVFQSKAEKQFVRESGHMAKVCENKPENVVKCYGRCTLRDGQLGLVMDLYDSDLMDIKCSLSEGKEILRQIAMGLKQLKKLDIVHCDIKPHNILRRTVNMGMFQIAVTDLGVSKHMSQTQKSNEARPGGTDKWMAPEIQGDMPYMTYGHPVDVYGFGLTAIFILTGQKPHPKGKEVEADELNKWIDKCIDDASLTDDKLIKFIKGCLKYCPDERIAKDKLIDHNFFHDEEEVQHLDEARALPRMSMDAGNHQKNCFT